MKGMRVDLPLFRQVFPGSQENQNWMIGHSAAGQACVVGAYEPPSLRERDDYEREDVPNSRTFNGPFADRLTTWAQHGVDHA